MERVDRYQRNRYRVNDEEERRAGRRIQLNNYYDYSLLFLTIFIVCFGVVMIYSASFYMASTKYGNPYFFVFSQLKGIVLGIVMMLLVSKLDYRFYMQKLPVIHLNLIQIAYVVALVLQIAVLFVGEEINGAKRWINIGGLQFQPSEISKIATILVVSYLIYLSPRAINKMKGLIRICIIMAPILALIAKENLSTAIIVSAILIGICFVGSKRKMHFFVTGAILIAAFALFVMFGDPFRMERFQIWRDLEGHPKGFQILQGLYAIASGGMFGTGLGQSMQKLGFIPESQNDMIFAIICEELGLVGAGIVIILFILLIWRIMTISNNAPDLFGGLICAGVMIQISVQVVLNIAVVTNFIPSTGVPLPFISCGGTSVAILLAEMGLVLGVSNQVRR